MELEHRRRERVSGVPRQSKLIAVVVCAFAGIVGGAVIGFFTMVTALSAIVGAIIGLVAGIAIGFFALHQSKRHDRKDAVLDREIGVIGGDIGASDRVRGAQSA